MPRRFVTPGTIAAVSSTFKTTQTLISAATVRPKMWSFMLSTLGAAADGVLEWIIQRFTAAGTTTAVTPRGLDPTDPAAAVATAGSNASAEPTYTANSSLLDIGINQRATYTWNAWTEGAQLVAPATAANGLGIAALSSVAPAYTGIAASQFNHEE
jgi:hypothetical protein